MILVRHPGSSSAEFNRNRTYVLSVSDVCRFCGHPGAGQVDHVVPRRFGGGDDVGNLAPAHGHDDRRGRSGIDYRCPTCGLACNQSFRNAVTGPTTPAGYRSRDWL